MAITLVASVSAVPGANGGATAAIDTTGATLLVISASWYGGTTTVVTASDAKGNTWTGLTNRVSGTGRHQWFYVSSPTVGSGHTFTIAGVTTYPAVLVYAFADAGLYQTESGATNGGGTAQPVASGSVTPTQNGALIVTGLVAQGASATDSVAPAGFSSVLTRPFNGGVNVQGSAAYLVQATAAAINPTWSWTPASTHDSVAVGTAVFLPAVASTARVESYVWMPV